MTKRKCFAPVCFSIAGLITFLLLLFRFSPYPALSLFRNHAVSTRIYDSRGNLLQILPLENGVRREFVPLEQMPPAVKHLFVQAEDRRFYQHHGIDASAILRAAFQNVSEARTVSGASTITMQLARMIRPSERRTLFAKICEAFDALRLEMRLSKTQILELYLNNVPFGFNTEGVASASRTFFAAPLETLSDFQISCLAVIPRRPSLYNPLSNPASCASAAYELYDSYVSGTAGTASLEHHADADGKTGYSEMDFMLAAKSARSFSYPFEMPHFVRWLSRLPSSPLGIQPDVYTTADLDVQHQAEELLSCAVERYAQNRLTNGAVLVCDTKSGKIRAWAGSADFFDDRHNGQVDGILSRRQPGSSMKPFLYALALERGYGPSSVLPDVPMEFGFERLYVPQNFNNRFNGPVRLRVALASSLNVPAVHLLNEIGMETYLQKLRALHFDSLKDADPGLGLALGNAEVSLFELTQGFSVFARDGVFVPLRALDEPSESVLSDKNSDRESERVYDVNTARLVCDILSDAGSRAMGFGFSQVFQTSFPAMFKTGTANQYQNITALGATPQFTVGVWMGNFSGETVVGKTGSSVPAKIAKDMLVFLQGGRGASFEKPSQFKKERICALSGMIATERCPDTLSEYVATGRRHDSCTWHTAHGTSYPTEYTAWFRLKNRSGEVENRGAALRIVSPRSGSLFYYDDSVPARQQKLVVESIGGKADDARVFVDGAFFSQTSRPFVTYLPLSRGNHTVRVLCADEQAEISFTVK